MTQECEAKVILSEASWYCRMYSNVILPQHPEGCEKYHCFAVFMTPEAATRYRKCDVCGRIGTHMAHAASDDSLRPADPPFDRTLADDMADKRTL